MVDNSWTILDAERRLNRAAIKPRLDRNIVMLENENRRSTGLIQPIAWRLQRDDNLTQFQFARKKKPFNTLQNNS